MPSDADQPDGLAAKLAQADLGTVSIPPPPTARSLAAKASWLAPDHATAFTPVSRDAGIDSYLASSRDRLGAHPGARGAPVESLAPSKPPTGLRTRHSGRWTGVVTVVCVGFALIGAVVVLGGHGMAVHGSVAKAAPSSTSAHTVPGAPLASGPGESGSGAAVAPQINDPIGNQSGSAKANGSGQQAPPAGAGVSLSPSGPTAAPTQAPSATAQPTRTPAPTATPKPSPTPVAMQTSIFVGTTSSTFTFITKASGKATFTFNVGIACLVLDNSTSPNCPGTTNPSTATVAVGTHSIQFFTYSSHSITLKVVHL